MEVEYTTELNVFKNDTNWTDADYNSPKKPNLSGFYPILAVELGLSIICSLFLIFAYIIIGEHRTLPGKNVISISLCLIVTYVLLIIDLFLRKSIPYDICFAIGVVVQTMFLSTFFWTNVMSFDIMQTMASVNPEAERTKFWKYFIYAWLMTIICVVTSVVIDKTDWIAVDYKPKFGVDKCWLNGQLAFLIYFNAPVGLTLLANCIFFVRTAMTIVKVRSATAILEANRHKKRFRLCLKLVFIMGMVWILEFVPWITGIYYLYAVAGMLNCLHGVYLFFIFVCKRRILKHVASEIYCPCRKTSPPNQNKKQSASVDTIITNI